ncbi:MAG: alpha/beta hydrolase, partial [Nitrososphaerales archaeon]
LKIDGNAALYDLRPSLKQIRVPTLILAGAYEPPFYKLLHKTIKHSKLIIFYNSGHYPFVEERDKFIEVVRTFIESYGRSYMSEA